MLEFILIFILLTVFTIIIPLWLLIWLLELKPFNIYHECGDCGHYNRYFVNGFSVCDSCGNSKHHKKVVARMTFFGKWIKKE